MLSANTTRRLARWLCLFLVVMLVVAPLVGATRTGRRRPVFQRHGFADLVAALPLTTMRRVLRPSPLPADWLQTWTDRAACRTRAPNFL